uniref:Uncharacterized protein n=1 Tax=Acrobeloides nanus TaxID=290746 RepID=A0A914BXW9_9BILA
MQILVVAPERTQNAYQRFKKIHAAQIVVSKMAQKFIDPPDISFTNYFLDIISEFSEDVALIDPLTEKELKFSDFKIEIENFYLTLAKIGIHKNEVVGIFAGNSPEYLFLCLACWKLGAIICPLNPAYKRGEFEKYFKEVAISWLFTEKEYLEKFANVDIIATNKIFILEEFTKISIKEKCPIEKCHQAVKNNDNAVIFYSSGTTGPPKGVVLTHNALSAHLAIIISLRNSHDFLILTPNDTVFGVLPYFHAGGLLTLFCMLAQRAKVIINRKFSEEEFLKTIEKYQASILNLVPPLLEFLAYSPKISSYKLSSLRYIYVGAAKVNPELQNAVECRLQNLGETRLEKIIQLYGLTEAGVIVLMSPINEIASKKEGTCGIPLPGVECKIVYSESLQEVAPGDTGELILKTKTMMKEYFGEPEKTRQTFTSEGWLRTGDLVYKDSDGYFYIVGRVKELLKVRGWQVSPYELEEALKHNFSSIKEVVIIGLPDSSSGEIPAAVIVLQKDHQLDSKDVEDFVKDNFVSYKQLKGGVFFVDELPQTASGKINRPAVLNMVFKNN